MLTNARRTRRIAAGIGIACAALLAAGCNAQASPSVVVTDAPNPSVAYLAQGQDLNGKLLYRPGCGGAG